MARPLSKITIELEIPLSTDNLTDEQLERLVRKVRKETKGALMYLRIPFRTILTRTVVDDISIQDSNSISLL